MNKTSLLPLALAFALAGCGSKEATPDPSTSTPAAPGATSGAAAAPVPTAATPAAPSSVDRKLAAAYPGTEDGAKKLLSQFLAPATDKKALTAALRPDTADYQAIFTPELAAKIEASQAKMWASGEGIGAKDDQTELLLSSATADDFKAGNDKADKFPGGYKKLVGKLKPGVVLYRWKFVKPGSTIGMAYDGLAHVNGHWVFIPKPWRDAGEP